jgi:hypothetical protein
MVGPFLSAAALLVVIGILRHDQTAVQAGYGVAILAVLSFVSASVKRMRRRSS